MDSHLGGGELRLGFPKGQCWALSCSLIYINNIVDDLDCNIKLFADDTSLYVIVDEQNYIQAADMLSTDLSHIHNWSQNWAIKFNIQFYLLDEI